MPISDKNILSIFSNDDIKLHRKDFDVFEKYWNIFNKCDSCDFNVKNASKSSVHIKTHPKEKLITGLYVNYVKITIAI